MVLIEAIRFNLSTPLWTLVSWKEEVILGTGSELKLSMDVGLKD